VTGVSKHHSHSREERKEEEKSFLRKEHDPEAEVTDIPPCLIFIDKEGRWFHKGAEMIHREIIRLFYEHMSVDSLGRYVIEWAGERCYVEVEDTPFVVRGIEYQAHSEDHEDRFMLFLSDDTQEQLKPDTLYVGKENVLYCKVKDGRFPARFLRPAYYQMARYILEENGQFFISLNGRKYVIPCREQ